MVNSKEGRDKRVLLELVQGKIGATGVRWSQEWRKTVEEDLLVEKSKITS